MSEKCRNRVVVRYPSMCALRAHFGGGEFGRMGMKRKVMPALDETYEMETETAEEVIYRRVGYEEIGIRKDDWGFWVGDLEGRSGVCLTVLKSGGDGLKWGSTRKVKFVKEEKTNSEEKEGRKETDDDDDEDLKSDVELKKRKLVVYSGKKKRRVTKSTIGRWSKER